MRLLTTVLVLVFPCGSVQAQVTDPDYVLRFTEPPPIGSPGTQVTMQNIIDISGAGVGLTFWSLSICHNMAGNNLVEIVLDSVQVGAATAMVNDGDGPDFFAPNYFPGEGWTVGVVVNLLDQDNLPPGLNLELHTAVYDILAPGEATLQHCTLGNPPAQTILVNENGDTIYPVTQEGFINPNPPRSFIRGDVDGNGIVNVLVDSLLLLAFQFIGGPAPPCLEAADGDGNSVLNGLVDSLYILAHGFLGGPPPPAPYPECGPDPEPAASLGCESSSCP